MFELMAQEHIEFSPDAKNYFSNWQKIADFQFNVYEGFQYQIAAANTCEDIRLQCVDLYNLTLNAADSHLPAHYGQPNKILMSGGAGGQSYWGGQWAIKVADFEAVQLDTILVMAKKSQNLVTYSQDFSASDMVPYNAQPLVLNQPNIDGSNDAAKFITSTNNEPQKVIKEFYTTPANALITASVVVEKAGNYRYFGLYSNAMNSLETQGYAVFDLEEGKVVSAVTGGGSGLIRGEITDLGNGRFLCELRGQVRADNADRTHLDMRVLLTPTTSSFAGDGVSGVIIHHIRVNEGPIASPYVKTTDSPVSIDNPVNFTVKRPEVAGMHVIVRNAVSSTEPVTLVNPNATIISKYETWLPGENILMSPGDILEMQCVDTSVVNETWEIM